MKELMARLEKSRIHMMTLYWGVINFAKKNPSHVDILNRYLQENKNATTCDVIAFIARQPDFHKYSAVNSV